MKAARGKTTAKVIIFLPWLISPIVVGVIWRWMFGQDFGFVKLVISTLPWAVLLFSWSSHGLGRMVVIFAGAWGGTAFSMPPFIAALKNIPESLPQVAELDGANALEAGSCNVTLPGIAPTSFMVILLSTILCHELIRDDPGAEPTAAPARRTPSSSSTSTRPVLNSPRWATQVPLPWCLYGGPAGDRPHPAALQPEEGLIPWQQLPTSSRSRTRAPVAAAGQRGRAAAVGRPAKDGVPASASAPLTGLLWLIWWQSTRCRCCGSRPGRSSPGSQLCSSYPLSLIPRRVTFQGFIDAWGNRAENCRVRLPEHRHRLPWSPRRSRCSSPLQRHPLTDRGTPACLCCTSVHHHAAHRGDPELTFTG